MNLQGFFFNAKYILVKEEQCPRYDTKMYPSLMLKFRNGAKSTFIAITPMSTLT